MKPTTNGLDIVSHTFRSSRHSVPLGVHTPAGFMMVTTLHGFEGSIRLTLHHVNSFRTHLRQHAHAQVLRAHALADSCDWKNEAKSKNGKTEVNYDHRSGHKADTIFNMYLYLVYTILYLGNGYLRGYLPIGTKWWNHCACAVEVDCLVDTR